MKKVFISIFAMLLVFMGGCQVKNSEIRAKYVFLFIGDGMGTNQVYSTELYKAALDGKQGPEDLSFTDFPVETLVTTYSANDLITDSSAAGTAIASGKKTNNGYMNVDTTQTVKFETIAEKAKKAGFKVGILTSVSMDHATPACFYAHQNSRNMYYNISMELPKSGFDYFGGGGFINPNGLNNSQPNSFDNAVDKGYKLVNTREGFDHLKQGDTKILAVNPQIYPKGEFYWDIDHKEGAVSLAEFTRKGIEVLDNPKGFFMMVEGGKIDWACHRNDIATSIHETLAFDDAVKEAIAFYKQHLHETLILVTADHETGGLAMGNNKPLNLGILRYQNISSQEFSRKLEEFKIQNPKAGFEQVMELVEQHFGLGNPEKGMELSEAETKYLYAGYKLEFIDKIDDDPDVEYLKPTDQLLLTDRIIKLISSKAGVGWTSPYHTGTPVPLRALGVGEDYFKPHLDNTDISKLMAKVLSIN